MISRFFLIVLCLIAIAMPLAYPQKTAHPLASDGTTKIVGTVDVADMCERDELQAWVSAGRVLLYQSDISRKGDFEFAVLPGQYSLVIVSSSGCFAEQAITVASNETATVKLNLAPVSRGSR